MKAIVKHINTVYEALLKASKKEPIDGEEYHIYRGPISKLWSSLDIPQAYYSEVFYQLDIQGCITYLQRGSRSVETVVMLHYPPTEDGYKAKQRRGLTDAENFANMIELVRKHEKGLIGGIKIVEAFGELEDRIKRLEKNAGAREDVKEITLKPDITQ